MRALVALLPAAVIAGSAVGQYALDKDQRIGGTGINAAAPRPAVQRDIYSINRNTGTYTYDRAQAFNNDSYSIYQRYTSDRVGNFVPRGVSTGAAVQRESARAASRRVSAPRQTAPSTWSRTVSPLSSATRANAGSVGAPAVSQHRYSAATPPSRVPASTIQAPRYSVAK